MSSVGVVVGSVMFMVPRDALLLVDEASACCSLAAAMLVDVWRASWISVDR